ncbi:MAG: NAD(P)-dependent alcohol dehydrogenase [Microcystaceae cyanobacterium]
MKAVQINAYGTIDVLDVAEVEKPIPQGNELLVEVKASSVNPVDWKIRQGYVKLLSGNRFPLRLGADFAGIVRQVGAKVQDYQVGDEVYGFVNPINGGAYAQYLTISEEQIALKSPKLAFEAAAALPIAALTALQSLCDLGKVQGGMNVLINGASGGVGTFAVQIAKALETRVTGVCSSKNQALVEELGADRVIDYSQQDFTQEGVKYDLILDAVGKRTFAECLSCLTDKGIYITTLPSWQNFLPIVRSFVFGGKKAKVILAQSNNKDLKELNRLIDEKHLKVIIDQRFPLEGIKQAHQYSETGRTVGKIVITPICETFE